MHTLGQRATGAVGSRVDGVAGEARARMPGGPGARTNSLGFDVMMQRLAALLHRLCIANG